MQINQKKLYLGTHLLLTGYLIIIPSIDWFLSVRGKFVRMLCLFIHNNTLIPFVGKRYDSVASIVLLDHVLDNL